jgi:hypothetical protein
MVRCARSLILVATLAGCTERIQIHDVWDAAPDAPNAPDAADAPPTAILDTAQGELPGRSGPDACQTFPKHALFRSELADLMILVDRSSNMQANFPGSYSRLNAVQSVLTDLINTYQKSIKFGFAQFPDPGCGGRSTCCAAKWPTAEPGYSTELIFDALQCDEPQTCLSPSADSPSHDALAVVQSYRFLRDYQRKYVLLIAASEPSCSGEDSSEEACGQATGVANSLGGSDIPVVVLTVGYQPDQKSSCLVKVSKAGTKTDMPSGALRLYTPSTSSNLKDNLSTLFAAIGRNCCTLDSDYVPDDASLTIKLGNNIVPRADCSASSGWCYPDAASRNQIRFLGSTCDQYLQTSPPGDIWAEYSCSTCSDSGSFCYYW